MTRSIVLKWLHFRVGTQADDFRSTVTSTSSCHWVTAPRNSRVGLEAFNCLSKLFFFSFVMLRRCHHQPPWPQQASPREALLLMLRSLQEELRPYYHHLSVCGSMFSNWACARGYPPLPFEYSSPIPNKCPCFPLSGDAMTLEMIDNYFWRRVWFNSLGGTPFGFGNSSFCWRRAFSREKSRLHVTTATGSACFQVLSGDKARS